MTLEDRFDVLMEYLDNEFTRQAEAMSGMQKSIEKLQGDVEEIKEDVRYIRPIRTAMADVSEQVSNHETRITKLEKKAA